jgi:Uma2 family endonuclease
MPKTSTIIGPEDAGRRMSLAEFEAAEGIEGHLYELSRGIITVVDVPNPRHWRQIAVVRRQLMLYAAAHPDAVFDVATGSECKLVVADVDSERHPDLAVYGTPPGDDPGVWSTLVPELVIEVVSPGSEHRDYVEKREEYLRFGVKEYWIIDEAKDQLLVLSRVRSGWRERTVKAPEVYEPTVLPGLRFDLMPVFKAARG